MYKSIRYIYVHLYINIMCFSSHFKNERYFVVSINEAISKMNQSITSRKNHSDTSSNETYFNYFDYASEEEVKELYKRYDNNQAVSDEVYWILIVAYSILIVVGCIGNLGVIIAVAGNKSKSSQNPSWHLLLKNYSFQK